MKDGNEKSQGESFQPELNFQIPWFRCTGKLAEGAVRKYGWSPPEKEGEVDEAKKNEQLGESTSE